MQLISGSVTEHPWSSIIEFISEDRTQFGGLLGNRQQRAPPPSIIFCATLRRAQNHPRGSYIWVKLVCGSNELVHFRIRHREPCENQLQRRKMLAKSGSGNNAQTAGNQEFWRNIQGRLRACYGRIWIGFVLLMRVHGPERIRVEFFRWNFHSWYPRSPCKLDSVDRDICYNNQNNKHPEFWQEGHHKVAELFCEPLVMILDGLERL